MNNIDKTEEGFDLTNFTEEEKLIHIAQWDRDDDKAHKAMLELKEKFDPTYHYCSDCDDLVTTVAACCLNNKLLNMDGTESEDQPF